KAEDGTCARRGLRLAERWVGNRNSNRGAEARSQGLGLRREMMFIVTWVQTTLRQYPEIAIFLTLALGYYFGKFTFKGIGLGSVTATLLAGALCVHIGLH